MIPVADQFEDIRKRRDEIAQSEGKSVPEPVQPPADTEQPRMEDYACGLTAHQYRWTATGYRFNPETGAFDWFEEQSPLPGEGLDALIAEIEAKMSREPGEFTDGA